MLCVARESERARRVGSQSKGGGREERRLPSSLFLPLGGFSTFLFFFSTFSFPPRQFAGYGERRRERGRKPGKEEEKAHSYTHSHPTWKMEEEEEEEGGREREGEEGGVGGAGREDTSQADSGGRDRLNIIVDLISGLF